MATDFIKISDFWKTTAAWNKPETLSETGTDIIFSHILTVVLYFKKGANNHNVRNFWFL